MKKQHTAKKTDQKGLKISCEHEANRSFENASYGRISQNGFIDLQSIWDAYLCKITVTEHQIEQNPRNIQAIHSETYQVGSKDVEF